MKKAVERINRCKGPPLTGKTIEAQSGSNGNGWPAPCGVIDFNRQRVTGEGFLITTTKGDAPRPLQSGFTHFLLPSLLVLSVSGRCCRYKTALGESVQTDALFSSSSLRGLEESLFCPSRKKSSAPAAEPGSSWDAYWEHNEPLRDVDEVAIPVLSICARDDPVRGDTQSTVPLELFETNPHFFLLLTDRGGHCGFSTQWEGGVVRALGAASPAAPPNTGVGNHGANWSHKALLEFFRATTDFFAAEDRAKQLAARRRGLGGSISGKMLRHRSVSSCKRVPACSHNIHAIYNWQRSYTR